MQMVSGQRRQRACASALAPARVRHAPSLRLDMAPQTAVLRVPLMIYIPIAGEARRTDVSEPRQVSRVLPPENYGVRAGSAGNE